MVAYATSSASSSARSAQHRRIREGLAWFDAAIADQNAQPAEVAPAVRAAVLADKATLNALMGATDTMEQAHEALAIAREVDDPALLLRALAACGGIAVYDPEVARPYVAEAIGLARSMGDGWRLSHILNWQAFGGVMVGDPIAIRAAAEEGRDLADAIGERFASHGPQRHVEDGLRLGQWVAVQRANREQMSPERVRLLEALPGWSWTPFTDRWERAYTVLVKFTEREGHARVPNSCVGDGVNLG